MCVRGVRATVCVVYLNNVFWLASNPDPCHFPSFWDFRIFGFISPFLHDNDTFLSTTILTCAFIFKDATRLFIFKILYINPLGCHNNEITICDYFLLLTKVALQITLSTLTGEHCRFEMLNETPFRTRSGPTYLCTNVSSGTRTTSARSGWWTTRSS